MALQRTSVLDSLLQILPNLEKIVPVSSKLLKELGAAANVAQLVRAWDYLVNMKNMIMARAPVEKIRESIPDHPWTNEYFNNNSTMISANPHEACSKLSECFEAEYRSLSMQMIGNATVSLLQSVKAWWALHKLKNSLRDKTIPSYERQREKVQGYIEECAGDMNPLILLEQLDPEQTHQLKRARERLDDAKNVLDSIHQDCENKIREAENHRSANGLSAVVNLVAFGIELLSFHRMVSTKTEWKLPEVAAAFSTTTHGIAAAGDICATYSADSLVDELRAQLSLINQLETECNTLATRLSTINR